MDRFDYILLGGGLQNGLIALALFHRDPSVRIALIDQGPRIGGNHTWSFHDTDVPADCRAWFDPLVAARWPEYVVRFPNRTRVVKIGYGSILSDTFHECVVQRFQESTGSRLLLQTKALAAREREVTLADGTVLAGDLVVDARGPGEVTRQTGYQKFVGWEVELAEPMADTRPIIMDACVEQIDGYRFLYVLPFTPTRVLFEETYFSNEPTLDPWSIEPRLDAYLAERGHRYARVARKEEGVLPMPWGKTNAPAHEEGIIEAGYKGGWFHPATGYSLPIALRLARKLAALHPHRPEHFFALEEHWRRHRINARYGRLLNFLLFRGFPPARRWNVFERFYGFSEEMIGRFYALEMTAWDRARLLSGRPPRGMSVKYFVQGR